MWKPMPTSVKNPSTFLPVSASRARSRMRSRNSTASRHGSVETRSNDRSSFLGLKSSFFCFVRRKLRCKWIAGTTTDISIVLDKSPSRERVHSAPSSTRPTSALVLLSTACKLVAWNEASSLRTGPEPLASGTSAVVQYRCQRWTRRSAC